MKDGAVETVKAERMVTDGAGTRFYDAEGNAVAVYRDGLIDRAKLK